MHSSFASNSQPTGAIITGDLWWDTLNLQLKVWSGSTWLVIGPASSAGGSGTTTGALPVSITDTNNNSHAVVEFSIANQIIGIVSKDAVFTPATAIPGFANVYPGINLINSSSLAGSQFTGNATNALAVNNVSSTSFMRSDQNTSTTGVLSVVNNTGLTIGSSSTVTIGSPNSSEVRMTNNTSNSDINFWVNQSGSPIHPLNINAASGAVNVLTSLTMPGATSSGSILPNSSNVYSLGSTTAWWNNVYGTSVHAVYADLAEIYATDQEYPAGTVVCVGGTSEVTAANAGDYAIGVISENPAYLMNSKAPGQPVALKGRVPVLVKGPIAKGDRLVPSDGGRAERSATSTPFAIALGNNSSGNGVVECIIL